MGYPLAPHFYGFHELVQARTKDSKIKIGDNTILSNDIVLVAVKSIEIGENCLIGDRLTIYDCDGHEINPLFRNNSVGKISPVFIGDNVWIGSMVTILKGVSIGNNSIVAANSVVAHDVPNNSIVAGNPAKVVKEIKGFDSECKEMFKKNIECLINNGNFIEAKKLINQYKINVPNDIEIFSMESVINILDNNLEEAESILKEGLHIENDNFDLLHNLAYVYEIKNEKTESIKYYKKAVENCKDVKLKNEVMNKINELI